MNLKLTAAVRHALAVAAAVATGLSLAPAASAQQATEEAQGLEEVIVTARKVEENLQQTPIAVTVLSGDALAERQVFNTSVLDQVVPNLQFGNNAPLAGNNSSSQVFISTWPEEGAVQLYHTVCSPMKLWPSLGLVV